MAGQKITEDFVERAVCPPGKKDALFFDSRTQGFGLRVTSAGSKTFLAQFKAAGGKRRVPLGTFGVMTVDQARKKARAMLGQVADGRDPVAERKAKEAEQKKASAEAAFTVRRLIEDWATAREGDRRPTYITIARAHLLRNLASWLDRPASGITLAEAVHLLDDLKAKKGTVTANRTLAYARAAYGWAVKRQALVANPLRGIERPGREIPRDRVLTAPELGAIWNACEKLGPSLAGAVRTMMLTLQRREEVASMHWTELDSVTNPTAWTLPRQRAKNGRAHVVHLSEPVRAIIRAMPRIHDHPFVFAGQGNRARPGVPANSVAKPVAAFSFAKDEIDGALAGKIEPWTFHDFRRAGVTMLADAGFAPHICDRLLNHITGSIQGVALVYQRSEFLPERKAALDAWAAFVMAAAEGKAAPSNVVPMARTAANG